MASPPAHDSGPRAGDKHFDIRKQKNLNFHVNTQEDRKRPVFCDSSLFSNPKRHRAGKALASMRAENSPGGGISVSFVTTECPFVWLETPPPQTCLGHAVKWELHHVFHCF